MKLLAGDPIDLGICKVHPLTLREIKDIGELEYMNYLNSVLIGKKSLKGNDAFNQEALNELTDYQIIIVLSLQDVSFREVITKSFECFFKEKIHLHNNGFFYFGEINDNRFIDDSLFLKIIDVIKKQNFINEDEKKDFNPANDKAKELIEKMNKVKKKLQEQNKEEGLNLSDIISIVSAYSPDINIFNVWNLTVNQLYELYLRLIMWDEYHANFTLLPHVTDNKSLNLKHWASKINIKNSKEE